MTIFKCPFTNKEIKGLALANHILYQHKKFNIDKTEFRFQIYANTFPKEICTKDGLEELYCKRLYSIPDFKREYSINAANLFFLLDYFGIPHRNIQESSLLISRVKQQKTLKEKYGDEITNISQLDSVKKKKAETSMKNYGVDNIWKTEDYLSRAEAGFIRNHGITRGEFLSIQGSRTWAEKSTEEREKWLDASIRSEKAFENNEKRRGYNKSSLEDELCLILNELEIDYQHSFCIKKSPKKRYFYDFLLPKANIIIELNGDYWHANPDIYTGTDLIHYRWDNITATDIWEKDKIKIDYAKSLRYIVIVIWEKDIKEQRKNNNYKSFIKQKIYDEISKNQENIKN